MVTVYRPTYCQVDFSTFGDFFREDSEELQYAVPSAVCQRGAYGLKDILPFYHLYSDIG